jgi:hypothetical protein
MYLEVVRSRFLPMEAATLIPNGLHGRDPGPYQAARDYARDAWRAKLVWGEGTLANEPGAEGNAHQSYKGR